MIHNRGLELGNASFCMGSHYPGSGRRPGRSRVRSRNLLVYFARSWGRRAAGRVLAGRSLRGSRMGPKHSSMIDIARGR